MTERLGPILQFSYVVKDLAVAIDHWARVLQVGPFFVLEHVPYKTCRFRGEPTDIDMSVALAYTGDTQIELVQQHNDAPSIFREFLVARGEGLQHVGAISSNLDGDLAMLAKRGVAPVQDGEADNGTRFAYLDTDYYPGTMLELFQVPEQVASAFGYMRMKASTWDPVKDPVRR